MASNTIFSKKNLPETKISFKSHLHKTIIISDFKSFNEEENRILYTINFSDEAIENSQIFQVDVGIPQEYTLNESIILIVGVLNKALKPFHRKLNPSAQYQFFQAKKNGKPKLDLPSKNK